MASLHLRIGQLRSDAAEAGHLRPARRGSVTRFARHVPRPWLKRREFVSGMGGSGATGGDPCAQEAPRWIAEGRVMVSTGKLNLP